VITTRFREVVWTGNVCLAALSFYLMSQTVAAKRAELAGVERSITAANQEIRHLRTEIDTRGGLAQIESWNASVYGLQAPGADQFVASSIRLVAMTQPPQARSLPLDPAIVASHGAVDKVSLDMIEEGAMSDGRSKATPAATATAVPAHPILRQANYVQAKPSALAPAAASPVHEIAARQPAPSAFKSGAALGDDFLADIGHEDVTASRKVKP